jgi:hypothetical protein
MFWFPGNGGRVSTLRKGLVECWQFEVGASLGKSSLGHEATPVNTPTQVDGRTGNGVQLTAASTQYLSILAASAGDFYPAGADFTVGGWFYLDTLGTQRFLFDRYAASNLCWGVLIQSSNRLAFNVSTDGTAAIAAVITSPTAASGVWNNFMAWRSGDATWVSLNNGAAVSGAVTGALFNGTANLNIGIRNNGASDPWNGRLDTICYWNRALSDVERAAFYRNGVGWGYPFR